MNDISTINRQKILSEQDITKDILFEVEFAPRPYNAVMYKKVFRVTKYHKGDIYCEFVHQIFSASDLWDEYEHDGDDIYEFLNEQVQKDYNFYYIGKVENFPEYFI